MKSNRRDHFLEVLPQLLDEVRQTSRQGHAVSSVLHSYGVSTILLQDLLNLGLLERTHAGKRRPQYRWVENELSTGEIVGELLKARDRRARKRVQIRTAYERNRLDQRRCSRCGLLIGYGKVYLSRPTMTQPQSICTACVTYFDQPPKERELIRCTRLLLEVGEHVYSHELNTYEGLLLEVAQNLREAHGRDQLLESYPELADHADTIRQWLDGARRIYGRHLTRCHELHAQLGRIYTVGDLRYQSSSVLNEKLQDIELQETLQRELRYHGAIMQEALQHVARWLRGLGALLEARHLHAKPQPQPTHA